jgi:hypothetical protein
MPALREVLRMPNASTHKYSNFFRKKQGKNFLRHFCQVLVFFRLFRNKQGKEATKALQVYILTRVFTLGAT